MEGGLLSGQVVKVRAERVTLQDRVCFLEKGEEKFRVGGGMGCYGQNFNPVASGKNQCFENPFPSGKGFEGVIEMFLGICQSFPDLDGSRFVVDARQSQSQQVVPSSPGVTFFPSGKE